MTPLRQQMIEAMKQRGFSPRTHKSYLDAVSQLSCHYHCPPDRLSLTQLQGFFDHLVQERNLAPASCRLYLNGIRFFYLHVLKWEHFDVPLITPKRQQRIPELLTRNEVKRLLASLDNPKHRTMLTLCYGCGLRVSELVRVQVQHIDGERGLLRIEQGKGAKDRLVPLSQGLLSQLRHYWQAQRPAGWLFPNDRHREKAVSISTAQKVYHHAKAVGRIVKVGGIHALRHAYATHQLEAGLPVHRLQRLLGHTNLQSTMRYVHWVPSSAPNAEPLDLIASLEVDDG